MTGREHRGGGNRIIGGGVQNRFGGGVLWYVSPPLSFPPPFVFFDLVAHDLAPFFSENLRLSTRNFTGVSVLQQFILDIGHDSETSLSQE